MIFDPEAKLIAGAVAALALAGGVWYVVDDLEARGAQAEKLAVAQQHDRDVAAAREQEDQIHRDQESANHEADRFRTAAQLDARDARDSDGRLQQRFAAINARCVPSDPAASAGGPATDDAARVRADVLGRVVAAARLAASAADGARGAGQLAEHDYDALTAGQAAR